MIVVEDENGNIVRETMKDTDTLARYKTMHETLVYLSHLDHDDTESQMLEKLRLQVCVLVAIETCESATHAGRALECNTIALQALPACVLAALLPYLTCPHVACLGRRLPHVACLFLASVRALT